MSGNLDSGGNLSPLPACGKRGGDKPAMPTCAWVRGRAELMRGANKPKTSRARSLRRAQTSAEAKLWSKLRNRQLAGAKFVRQEPIGPYFADFCCREQRLVIELDGATHSTDAERARDAIRTRALEAQTYRVLRFTNADVYDSLDAVCDTIFANFVSPSRP